MKRASSATNRIILTLVGLLLTLAGLGWALVLAEPFLGLAEQMGLAVPSGRIFTLPITGVWAALALGVVGLIVAVLGAWFALRQIPARTSVSAYTWHPSTDQAQGTTSVDASALSQAIADDATGLSGVAQTKVVLFGAAASPEMLMQLTIDDRADIHSVLTSLEKAVIPNAQEAIGTPLHHVGIRIRTGGHADSVSTVEIVPA